MLIEQNYCCAICDSKFKEVIRKDNKKDSGYCIDHKHLTGEVRALLCGNCNKAIGLLKESITNLENAINYLKKFDNK